MKLEKIVTQDLMHFSYMVMDDGKALVVDPRWDYEVYLDLAKKAAVQISGIFETHRNEDIRSGAGKLGEATGAKVFRGNQEGLAYEYGQDFADDEVFVLSEEVQLRGIHTPGHTLSHMSYLVEYQGKPTMLFTGDCLFYGGVGRTDFYGEDRLEEMTGMLHDSLYGKIKPLGEGLIILPAHGSGSACGDDMDERPLSTWGYEAKYNPALTEDRATFIEKNGHMRHKNPAFSAMEVSNLTCQGSSQAGLVKEGKLGEGQIVDLRDYGAFHQGHIPGSMSLPAGLVSAYAGWFLNTEEPICLLWDNLSPDELDEALRTLQRQGFEKVTVLPEGTLTQLKMRGESLERTQTIDPKQYAALVDPLTLDVRKAEEFTPEDPIKQRIAIPLQELKGRVVELEKAGPIHVICQSGIRSSVASSWLKNCQGKEVVLVDGGVAGLLALKE